MGEVQPPQTARSRTRPRGAPGNDFLAMLFKQKLLGMIKIVTSSSFRIPEIIFLNIIRINARGASNAQRCE